ncbi:MAG: glycosyltransferase [Bacteroidetes bacterium 4572_112]|nr:MAG: glycosyltransferase [Bacteroidetes bacterium 4572_112]
MQISVVIATFNEEESLPELTEWIVRVMNDNNFTYEVIYVDDGSKDKSWEIIDGLSKANPNIKGIKFRRNYGKSAALNRAFDAAEGDVIITMDADLQDSPDEIPELYRMIVEDGFDLVSGWKKKRHDPLSKTIPTKLYNAATRRVTKTGLHDMNCGLKSYRKDVIKTVEVYGEMHRYIPAMAKWAGFTKIGEKVVEHRKRPYGYSKFGLERFINGFLDLLSITFISKFGKRPMHLFGTLGTLLFMIGFGILTYLSFAKLFMDQFHMTDRPLFFFALLAMMMGTTLFVSGFLGELIARNSSIRNEYLIEKSVGIDE